MNGINGLREAVKTAVDNRISNESRALRGVIRNGKFLSGSKSFPFVQAVDCDTSNGSKVWAQLSKNGSAVIVGK